MTVKAKKLTSLEIARFKRFKKTHKGAKVYYTTELSLGVGYDILASTLDLTVEENMMLINESNTKIITDELHELGVI